MSPFAHPLFTVLTGIGFGIAATRYPRRRAARIALALLGLLTAVLLHAIWNGASSLGDPGFLIVYGLFMVPVLIALTWLAIWARNQELLSLRGYLAGEAARGVDAARRAQRRGGGGARAGRHRGRDRSMHARRSSATPFSGDRIIESAHARQPRLPAREREQVGPLGVLLGAIAAGVAGFGIDAQEHGAAARRRCLEAREQLRGLPVGDARVLGADREQHAGVRDAAPHAMVRIRREDRAEVGGVRRIAVLALVVAAGRERARAHGIADRRAQDGGGGRAAS